MVDVFLDRKIGRDVIVMATGDAPAETEVPEFVKTLQDAWDKVDDKYAVGSLVVASVIALWGSTGLISVGMEEGLDCRLPFLVKMLNITWVSLHPHEISLKDIDQVAKTSFPLCMRHLFDKLEEDHHLKHGGRMQLGLFLKVQTNRKRDFVYIVIPMWSKGVPSSTTMQQILFWQVEVSTTGIQLHQQMRCSSSYCHESSRHGVGNEQ
ncbi:protein CURVATURE THYLAKOID 1B, chloroplastic [Trifolium repens]|nr:protein CURVATURE THYLAKOID 1B, chloroplastic [Trifolium repens]